VLAPTAALALAQQLLDAGRPFHAHEVLEDAWKAAPDAERALWKGLAQLAVGITHARRGNAHGAAALLSRGAAAVDGYPGRPHGIDAPGLAAAARSLAALIERDGLAAVPAAALVPRLTAATAPGVP
jgi:predicted metal-dependent hydrolase